MIEAQRCIQRFVFTCGWLSLVGVLQAGAVGEIAAQVAATSTNAVSMACDVSPRTPAEILALAEPTNYAGEPALALPTVTPADTKTLREIDEAVRTLEACLNTADMLRVYALYSDQWLQQQPADAAQRASIQALATASPSPAPEGMRAVFIGPWQVQVLPDGRVMAAVLLTGEEELEPNPRRTQVLIFAKEYNRWLIDENHTVVQVPHCEVPVPVEAVVGAPGSTELIRESEISCDQ
ncbi:MAG: hypothetical protein M3Z20_21390 [Chloroflexota bacterium]|nr:hypothetical protein [Chloroflexota bacterium]